MFLYMVVLQIRLGIPGSFYPPIEFKIENNDITRSLYVPDEVLNQLHPRFKYENCNFISFNI